MPVPSGCRALVALVLVSVGCQRVPVAEGPRIPVASTPAASAPASPIRQAAYFEPAGATSTMEFAIDDRRPDWERQFRSPAVAPSQYEHAIGFVALENLEPPNALERTVRRAVARGGMQVASARVELRSFRVVVDDTEALRHDHRVLDRVAGQSGVSIGPLRFGGAASSDPIETGPFADPVARQGSSFRPVLLRDGKKYLFGPPTQLPKRAYQAGVTCEIDATVVLTGPRGSTKTVLAQVRTHTAPEDATATATPADLATTVAAAYADMENRLVGQLSAR